MLFDAVQEQTDLDTTRVYSNTTPVQSGHSESDTLAYPPCVRIPSNRTKPSASPAPQTSRMPPEPSSPSASSTSSSQSILETGVHAATTHTPSPVTNTRSKSHHPAVPGYQSPDASLGGGSSSRIRAHVSKSPMRLDSNRSAGSRPHTYVTELLRWPNNSPEVYEHETNQSKSINSRPHRIRVRPSSGEPRDALVSLRSAHAAIPTGRSNQWRGQAAVAQLIATGSGQKTLLAPDRSPSGSRWTTESRWSPIDATGLSHTSGTPFQRGIRPIRTNTFRETFVDVVEANRPSRRRGESGRLSRAFAFKSIDPRGRPDRGSRPTRYGNSIRRPSTRASSGSERKEIYYCFNCLADRVHLRNVCTYCKRPGLIPKFARLEGYRDRAADLNPMAEHAKLLRTAARGLSELSQHSSDDEDDGDELSYQGSLPSTLGAPYSPYDSQPDRTSSDSQSTSSHHTYIMDSAGDMIKHLTEISKQEALKSQMDSACSLSNSGSFASDPDKPNGSGTYHRPKLPTTLMRHNQSPQLGKIIPVPSEFVTQTPVSGAQTATNEKTDNGFLSETQKLVAQLEQRMLTNGSCALNGTGKISALDARLTSEDQEVAEAFTNPNSVRSPGINRRLLAMLQRRNPHLQSPAGSENGRHSSLEHESGEVVPRRQSNPTRRDAGTTGTGARPKSQQPTSRLTTCDTDASQRNRDSIAKRNASQPRVTSYLYPEVASQPNTHRSTLIQASNHVRDGWEGIRQQALLKSTSVNSPRLQSNVASDNPKLSALLNWQRRKAYDPRNAIALNGSRVTGRASAHSLRDDDPASLSTDDDGQKPRLPENQTASSGTKVFYRNKHINRRTAPVETVDCIEALDSIQTANHKPFPAHCSVVSNLLTPHRLQTENGMKLGRSDTMHADRLGLAGPVSRGRPGTEQTESSTTKKKRVPRAVSVNSSVVENAHSQASDSTARRESRGSLKTSARKGTQVASSRTSTQTNGRVGTVRCASQTGHRTSPLARPSRDMGVATTDHDARSDNQSIPNDLNYPDIGVESIRYKIEKLTNFIVRMRKRIERDYAEQGTCSPGDDVFGDEAVGATVAGKSTGMHPVVASSLKNLRILEFNAQEIFSLLYPTEVDMWEPARACLAGDVGDEQTFNEARSKLTEHLSNCIQANEGGLARRHTPTQPAVQSGVQIPARVPDSPSDSPLVPDPVVTAPQEAGDRS